MFTIIFQFALHTSGSMFRKKWVVVHKLAYELECIFCKCIFNDEVDRKDNEPHTQVEPLNSYFHCFILLFSITLVWAYQHPMSFHRHTFRHNRDKPSSWRYFVLKLLFSMLDFVMTIRFKCCQLIVNFEGELPKHVRTHWRTITNAHFTATWYQFCRTNYHFKAKMFAGPSFVVEPKHDEDLDNKMQWSQKECWILLCDAIKFCNYWF